MVHSYRGNGASIPCEWCTIFLLGSSVVAATVGHGHHATRLFRNGVQPSHGFTFNGQYIRVVHDPVAYGISHGRIIQQLMPAGNVEPGTEDSGCYLTSCLDQFQQVPCFTFHQRIQKALIQNKQFALSGFPHQFTIGPVTTSHCGLYQKIWQANIFCAVIIAVGGDPKGACR